MIEWFLRLPPGEQVSLIVQSAFGLVSLGAYLATMKFLAQRVKEQGEKLGEHDTKLEKHGEKIAALEAVSVAARHR